MSAEPNIAAPLSDRQRRFLDAYRERLAIAPAARLACVHRASVYRWQRDPAFVAALKVAAEEFFRNARAKWEEQEAARQKWREQRERDRRQQRCENLARARAAKRGAAGGQG